jgi:hypothetical protein
VTVALVVVLTIAQPAAADFGIQPDPVNSALPDFHSDVVEGDGVTPYTQAGGHGFQLTTQFSFNTLTPFSEPDGRVKDIQVDLPPGIVGNPTAASKCELAGLRDAYNCSSSSQVGVADLGLWSIFPFTQQVAVYNLDPSPGDVATLGFYVQGVVITIHIHVRTGSDYGITAAIPGVSEVVPVRTSSLTLWGIPADPSHDTLRSCGPQTPISGSPCPSADVRKAFLTNSFNCSTGAPTTTLHVDPWEDPANLKTYTYTSAVGVEGCNKLVFDPSITVGPSSSAVGAPSGYTVRLHVPQHDIPDGVSTPPVRKAVVTLPVGVRISPSAADGLKGCTDAEIGLSSTEAGHCPDGSKLGTVEIKTPLLPEPLSGSVYQGAPIAGRLLRIFVEATGVGVRVKLLGNVDVDPDTGQITTTFDNTPQLPFSDFELRFKGGPRAPLSNPTTCGTHATSGQLTAWSAPATPIATVSDSFDLTFDGRGAPCPVTRPFSPSFSAGMQNPVAGGFSPFALRLTRTDSDGELSSLSSLSMPPGLLADVRTISTRCTIEQADAASCPAASHIGDVTVGAGPGPDPFYVGGDVYLTTSYKGNPFGIAVIVHAAAGPFDLGYVVVKGGIQVRDDGSITTTTDPFPTILQGVPLQLRDIRVNLDRPNFMFNPTSCNAMSVGGTVISTGGQSAQVSNRFQVGECRNMPFHPKFAATTQGKAKLGGNGASLNVKIAMASGPEVTAGKEEANISKVDVRLPKALPSRLSTLQKSCTAAQFAKDPAGCPAASDVGMAVANTPILEVPLVGPAYLVSHGGGAFPDLVLVLQGEGIAIHLTGHTEIKKGFTYSRFETVPDAPISSFELKLPEGPHSALSANTKLCGKKLLMPTTITGQNGAVLKQSTRIAVTGCPKAKKPHKRSSHKKKR